MDRNDFFIKTQIFSDISRISELINSGVFNANVLMIFHESIFTEIIIKLNDLLQKLNNLDHRIGFNNDVSSGDDITDLVLQIRNVVCHMDSGEHLLDKNRKIKFTFNVFYGSGNFSINGKNISSDYKDDICFFFGEHKIYLKRHIIRCVQEINEKLSEIYKK